jgi:hypothetical protein
MALNHEGYTRKWLRLNLRDCISMYLDILRKTREELSQANWIPIQELKPGPPKHEAEALVGISPQFSVTQPSWMLNCVHRQYTLLRHTLRYILE